MNDSMKINENDLSLLELAAKNDVDGFKRLIDCTSFTINDVGLWYGRQRSSKRMLMEHRTPLMIAATYGSLDVIKFILSSPETDVNTSCGTDKTTALHCAASSGSPNSLEVIKILLISGGDIDLVDANGFRPVDVIFVPINLPRLKFALEKSLQNEKKEYPIDPFFPDLKSDTFSSDEFRMFAFKIRPCSRAYSHDWTECPFIHPGESARRRDPRKIHYSCVPCPDYKKGQCCFGDFCEFAHGVFECWLHPAQYRTRLCKDGTFCSRRVCFFAHTNEQLRPLYVSTGPTLLSPRGSLVSASAMSPPPMLQLLGGSFQTSQMAVLHQLSPMNQYWPNGFYGISSNKIVPPSSPQKSAKGNLDWSVNGCEPVRTTRLQTTEPDVSWVQSLVKEPPQPGAEHSTLGAWLENMHLDQILA